MNLRVQITAALAGATSQNPIDTATLAQGHSLRSVKAELMGMPTERQIMCCKITKDDKERVVWWPTGVLPRTPTQMLNNAVRKKYAAVEAVV